MNHEALVGRTVAGKYLIESIVGQGAMGAVYKAIQTSLGTTLALKVLHRHLAGEPMFAARFLLEAQAASRVDHPNSTRVIDFGEEPDGLLYIAMEYLSGRTLAKIIETESPLPVARIVDIASQTLAALAVAHDIGVVHRDLKPENIMVTDGPDDEGQIHDVVKVCDFGVAKLLEGGARAPGVTADGLVVGTPEYMSPEQARGGTLDVRSDIYAMGVLLFHLMTGKVPFDSSTALGTAFMHVNDEPTRPRILNPKVDARLEAICLKAMRKRPEERYVSARELRSELRALLTSPAVGADEGRAVDVGRPTSGGLLEQVDARPRRSPWLAGGVMLAAGACVGGLAYSRSAGQHLPENVQSATVSSAVLAALPPPVASAPLVERTAEHPPSEPHEPPLSPPPSTAASVPPAPRPHSWIKANARRLGAKGRTGSPGSAAVEESPPLPEPASANGALPRAQGAPPSGHGSEVNASGTAKMPPVLTAPSARPETEATESVNNGPSKPADPPDLPLPVFPIPAPDPAPGLAPSP